MSRWMFFKIFSIICYLCEILRFEEVQAIGKGHITKTVMMTIALAIRCNVDHLRPVSLVVKCRKQSLSKGFPIVQQLAKGNILRDMSNIEKYANRLSGGNVT